jgi:hypothetical protein
MEELARKAPPLPSDSLLAAQVRRMAETDLAYRARLRELENAFPSFMLSRLAGGSGFRMTNLLRHFLGDYVNRMSQFGPGSMPESFNVVEAFLQFSESYLTFDLREEREHLLRLYEYFSWYTADIGAIPRNPGALRNILTEGLVYSYDNIGAVNDFKLRAGDSDVVILGVSLVRHEHELSVIVAAGDPPNPPDTELERYWTGR